MAAVDDAPGRAAGEEHPPRPEDAIEVAVIVGAWGIRGGIKVKPFAADPQALFATSRWFLEPPLAPGPAAPNGRALPRSLRIVSAREQGEYIVATAHELPDRNAAEAMRGARIFVARSNFPTPEEGEYYWVDLIGSAVVNRAGRPLGTVTGLIETGPHCVLSIVGTDADAPATLIPFVDAYVDRVDLEARRIEVDWEFDAAG